MLLLAAFGVLGCSTPSEVAPLKLAIFHKQFFDQCPFGVPQPSLTLVTDLAKWQQMLASARTSPPPFEASAARFDTNSIIVIASRAMATPRTKLWVKDDAVTLVAGARRLRLDIEVAEVRPPPGSDEVTLVGLPCLVIRTSRVTGVDWIEARDAVTGTVLVETRVR